MKPSLGVAGPSAELDDPPSVGPGLRSLCAAVVVSEIGDWLLFIALPLVVLRDTGSALATSSVFLAELIPAVLIGTSCGPLLDRHDPARLLAWLTAAQALVVVPLLWAEPDRVWLVYAVAALQAGFTSLTTPAQQASVPSLVAQDDVARANALIDTASNVARLIGSPLGGALLPLLGLHGLVLADIATFIVSGAILTPLTTVANRVPPRPSDHRPTRPLGAIRQGARAVHGDRTLAAAQLISFLAAVAQGLFLVLFVLFVLQALHAGDGLVGVLRGVQAIGGVLGGLIVAVWLKRTSARTLTAVGLAGFALVSALSWNAPHLTTAAPYYVGLFIVVGIPATAFATGLTTQTQHASPATLRGRILSLLNVTQAIGQAVGIIAAGALSGIVPLSALLNAQAGCYAACAAIAWVAFRPRRQPPLASP